MYIEAARGSLLVHLGQRFEVADAEHLAKTVHLAPLRQLTLDFTSVRDLREAAVVRLARTLRALRAPKIVLRGTTRQQYRMLRYFGLETGFAPLSETFEDAPSRGTAH